MRYASFCVAVICIATMSALSAGEKEKVSKPDTVTFSRNAKGEVTIDCSGEKRYALTRFRAFLFPKEKDEDEDWIASIEITDRKPPHDSCDWKLSKPQSVTVRNIVLIVTKYEGKILFEHYGSRYELIKGDMPDPKDTRPQGTLTWKKSDGPYEFFHEAGSGRVWKRYYWLDDKKKEEKEK